MKRNRLLKLQVILLVTCLMAQVCIPTIEASTEHLSPFSRINDPHFRKSFTALSLCELIEKEGGVDSLDNVRERLQTVRDQYDSINITFLPSEVVIDIPDDGIAIRYFMPHAEDVSPVTPYSDVRELRTYPLSDALFMQVIKRVDILPDYRMPVSNERREAEDNVSRLRKDLASRIEKNVRDYDLSKKDRRDPGELRLLAGMKSDFDDYQASISDREINEFHVMLNAIGKGTFSIRGLERFIDRITPLGIKGVAHSWPMREKGPHGFGFGRQLELTMNYDRYKDNMITDTHEILLGQFERMAESIYTLMTGDRYGDVTPDITKEKIDDFFNGYRKSVLSPEEVEILHLIVALHDFGKYFRKKIDPVTGKVVGIDPMNAEEKQRAGDWDVTSAIFADRFLERMGYDKVRRAIIGFVIEYQDYLWCILAPEPGKTNPVKNKDTLIRGIAGVIEECAQISDTPTEVITDRCLAMLAFFFAVDIRAGGDRYLNDSLIDELWKLRRPSDSRYEERIRNLVPLRQDAPPEEELALLEGAAFTEIDKRHMNDLVDAALARYGGRKKAGLPIAARIVDRYGREIVTSFRGPKDRPSKYGAPAVHAEMNAIRNAEAQGFTDWEHATIYTTLEPCYFCGTAISENYGFKRVVFGLRDLGLTEKDRNDDTYEKHHVTLVAADDAVLERRLSALYEKFMASGPWSGDASWFMDSVIEWEREKRDAFRAVYRRKYGKDIQVIMFDVDLWSRHEDKPWFPMAIPGDYPDTRGEMLLSHIARQWENLNPDKQFVLFLHGAVNHCFTARRAIRDMGCFKDSDIMAFRDRNNLRETVEDPANEDYLFLKDPEYRNILLHTTLKTMAMAREREVKTVMVNGFSAKPAAELFRLCWEECYPHVPVPEMVFLEHAGQVMTGRYKENAVIEEIGRAVRPEMLEETILVLDDICTRGYTLAETKRILRERFGAKDVYAASLFYWDADEADEPGRVDDAVDRTGHEYTLDEYASDSNWYKARASLRRAMDWAGGETDDRYISAQSEMRLIFEEYLPHDLRILSKEARETFRKDEKRRQRSDSQAFVWRLEGMIKPRFGAIGGMEELVSEGEQLIRVPVEVLESMKLEDKECVKAYLRAFQASPRSYVELFYMSGHVGELTKAVYGKYDLEQQDLSGFRRSRANTLTLLPVYKGEKISQTTIMERIGTVSMTLEDTLVLPIGLENDSLGLITHTLLGLRIMKVIREIGKQGLTDKVRRRGVKALDQDFIDSYIRRPILEEYKHICNSEEPFTLRPKDIIKLAMGKNIVKVVNKLIRLLPITPIDPEHLREIYELAREVIQAA